MRTSKESPILEAALAAMTEADVDELTKQAEEEALDIFKKEEQTEK